MKRRLSRLAYPVVLVLGVAWAPSVHAQMGDDPCRSACERERKACVERCAAHRDPMVCEARCDDEAEDCVARCRDQPQAGNGRPHRPPTPLPDPLPATWLAHPVGTSFFGR